MPEPTEPAASGEGGALTRSLREALVLIADRTDERSPDPGVMCSDATFADTYNAFVNWRTAQALHRRGLVTYPYIGSGWDGDSTSIALTAEGWRALGRTCPIPPATARPLPLHRTEAGYPHCSTCDGGGCPDCTDPA